VLVINGNLELKANKKFIVTVQRKKKRVFKDQIPVPCVLNVTFRLDCTGKLNSYRLQVNDNIHRQSGRCEGQGPSREGSFNNLRFLL